MNEGAKQAGAIGRCKSGLGCERREVHGQAILAALPRMAHLPA